MLLATLSPTSIETGGCQHQSQSLPTHSDPWAHDTADNFQIQNSPGLKRKDLILEFAMNVKYF